MSNVFVLNTCKQRPTAHGSVWVRVIVLCVVMAGCLRAANSYLVHNLVADLPNTADHLDTKLVNPWGIAFSATSPFWLGNNHSGTSTLYDTSGTALSLIVQIPSPADPSMPGAPTGVIFNGTQGFTLAAGKPGTFLFCTEDGTIVGWNSSVDGTHGHILVDNSASAAVYKGCALGGTSDAPLLLAANFSAGKIDVWDGALKPVVNAGAFADPSVPAGFAPFNVANLGGKLYVAYAKPDDEKMDDVAGPGNGYLAVFDMSGVLLSHLVSKGPLNSPWGMAMAPAGFGDFGGKLLVSNFGDGQIHVFDPAAGTFVGTLYAAPGGIVGQPIVIPGIWALAFGNGGRGGDPATLYFTAGSPGPNGEPLESHGLFGSIQAAPSFLAGSVENGASFDGTLAPNTWVSILGGGLSASTRLWQASDFTGNKLPTELSGVSVTVNGEPAYINYVSPKQINFLAPADVAAGPAQIQVTSNGQGSAKVTANVTTVAPAFFLFSGTKYIAATHSDGKSLIGPPKLLTGLTTSPAEPGETVVLYGNGFGVTDPPAPNGEIVSSALPLVATPTITIGGANADVKFAGLTEAGLYQFNVVVPDGLPAGDAAVVAQVPGGQSQANAFLSIAAPTP